MEFPPEIYVPYGPYMDFSTENATNRVHIWTFEKENDRRFQNPKFCHNIQHFQMAISTISMRPKFNILKNPKISFWGRRHGRRPMNDMANAPQASDGNNLGIAFQALEQSLTAKPAILLPQASILIVQCQVDQFR